MHEWGLVADAAREIEGSAGGSAVASVDLKIGPGADEATVRTAWASLTAGGVLSGAELVIEHQQDRLRCLGCGGEYGGRSPERCPACGGDGLVIAAAPDLTVHAWRAVPNDVQLDQPCA